MPPLSLSTIKKNAISFQIVVCSQAHHSEMFHLLCGCSFCWVEPTFSIWHILDSLCIQLLAAIFILSNWLSLGSASFFIMNHFVIRSPKLLYRCEQLSRCCQMLWRKHKQRCPNCPNCRHGAEEQIRRWQQTWSAGVARAKLQLLLFFTPWNINKALTGLESLSWPSFLFRSLVWE